MLSVIVFLPLAVAVALLALPRLSGRTANAVWLAATVVDLALVLLVPLVTGALAHRARRSRQGSAGKSSARARHDAFSSHRCC